MSVFDQPAVRGFFHWQYSGVVIPLFWGTMFAVVGLAATIDGLEFLFGWAYFFAACGFLWSVGYWLTSDVLEARNKTPTRRQRRGLEPYSRNKFFIFKWGVLGFLAIVFAGSLRLVYDVQLTRELHQLRGKLTPANDTTPPNPCGADTPQGSVVFLYGDNAALARRFPHTVLGSLTLGPLIALDRSEGGSLIVLMTIRAPDGKIIAQLDEHGYRVNQHNITEMRRPDRSSLILTDEYGAEVINIRYLNPQAVRIDGSFHYPGHADPTPLRFPGASNVCTKGVENGGMDVQIR